MTAESRGLCIIINNKHFSPNSHYSTRHGSERDVEGLRDVFISLQFDVYCYNDLSVEDMLNILKDHAKDQSKSYDALVVIISSHGCKEGIVCTNGGTVNGITILEIFNNVNCPLLSGKPKVFFIIACRGGKSKLFIIIF
jgi:hypothetical protein